MSNKFPENFIWGSATASYQIEGAFNEGGRGLSIWDVFSKTQDRILNGDTGDVACDHYHRFREDVALMKSLGLKAYRFSIAWPRIQPNGKGDGNPEGITFYNKLIDCLLEHGIEPWVTLYHWDLPACLQTEEDGWLNSKISDYFADYAKICFTQFGDRVKHWITLNEPWCSSALSYGFGVHAPGRRSERESYLAAHHLILAHAKAVQVYREAFADQKGKIGITNNCDFRIPASDSAEDQAAAERALVFFLGWFADPVWKGDYPEIMKNTLGDRLPTFTDEERRLIHGSSDFFGLNHYGSALASDPSSALDLKEMGVEGNGGISDDENVKLSTRPEWEKSHMGWNIVPEGCRKLLQWIDARYDHPEIYITENGCAVDEPDEETAKEDHLRRDYFEAYLSECRRAIEEGVNLKGYFAWSLMDNFEWAWGYTRRFGIVRVDYETQERTPKLSAHWFSETIKANGANVPTAHRFQY